MIRTEYHWQHITTQILQDLTVSGSDGNELDQMEEEIGVGVVLIHQKDVQLICSAWHLSVDLSIKEYLVLAQYIQQDLDQLLTKYPSPTPLKRKIIHLKITSKELINKTATFEQMFFLLLKDPVADFTEAPQPEGLMCNPIGKMMRFFLFFQFNGAMVE
jgi:hypothetical protein